MEVPSQAVRAVVVTGASSGIGRASARLLAKHGFLVFAGVREREDAEAVDAEGLDTMVPLMIDVTDAELIAAAVERVRDHVGSDGLYGLVNNAGIGLSGPVEYMPLQDLRRIFDVNVFGQIAVTQAFLPLIRQARGRIVNIGSVGDRITIPFGGALAGSKSAFAALTSALRMELRPFGIYVSLIEPGSVATPAIGKTLGYVDDLINQMPPRGREEYGSMLRRFTKRANHRERHGSPPEVIAEAVLKALTSAEPDTRYPVGKDSTLLTTLPRFVPEPLLDRLRMRMLGLPTRFGALAKDDRSHGTAREAL